MSKPNFKPWRFVGQGILIDDDENEIVLGSVYSDDQIGWLISAAPDLYAALRSEQDFWDAMRKRGSMPSDEADAWRQRFAAMREAALAKAEGR